MEAFDLKVIEKERIMEKAACYMGTASQTVTVAHCERSAGGPHDFYSEGDYWWPDSDNPDGPYIQRDGLSNSDNFTAHREAMIRLSEIVGTLTSAYLLTEDEVYVIQAVRHLKAWFVDPATKMNPHLLYGQAIKGRCTGRSIGVIDTIHLVEVALGVKILGQATAFEAPDFEAVKVWFRTYLTWLTSHPYGQQERVHPNNHGVCWSLQAGAFADLLGDEAILAWIRQQFKAVYLAEMMDRRGGFTAELKRTKPYGYSLFVLDAMAGVAQIASTPEDDLWIYTLPDGRGMRLGVDFIFPYIEDKSKWFLPPDVLYWEDWPVRQPSLLLAGLKFGRGDYLRVWLNLEADPQTPEVVRNLPLRYPLLWV